MSNLKLEVKDELELDALLEQVAELLMEDPSDQKAAAMLVGLVDAKVIDAEVARYLYGAAVRLAYFTSEGLKS